MVGSGRRNDKSVSIGQRVDMTKLVLLVVLYHVSIPKCFNQIVSLFNSGVHVVFLSCIIKHSFDDSSITYLAQYDKRLYWHILPIFRGSTYVHN